MIVMGADTSEGRILQLRAVLPSRELDKHEEIFTIILPLKTFHQSHPFPTLGKFH